MAILSGCCYCQAMNDDLAKRRCKPCEGDVPPLDAGQSMALMKALHNDWSFSADGLVISRTFTFPAYSRTMGFTNAVAWIATVEGHHPVLTISYGSCRVSYTTHAVDGLTDNDFICAAKIDRLAAESQADPN